MMSRLPRITFGIIVLNGEPFTRYNLRSLYPFAHEIIVVEGAAPGAVNIATPDGHSTDGTLQILRDFKASEDVSNKVTIVTAEDDGHPNGFWPGEKDEQSQAYAKRATGDYLWQVDIDEFYKPEDILAIAGMLISDPSITQVNLRWVNFWGGFDYIVDGLFLRKHYRALGGGVPRLFRWAPGSEYTTHRPPTVLDPSGTDTRKGRWITGDKLARKGIYCYHYGSVFPGPVLQRMRYYSSQNWYGRDKFLSWYDSSFVRVSRPFRVHHVMDELSWLTRFSGEHPPQIQQLIQDLDGLRPPGIRDCKDIEQFLSGKRYAAGVGCLQRLAPLLLMLQQAQPRCAGILARLIERAFSPSVRCDR